MPKKNKYRAESMEAAINEVKNNNMSYRNAAHKYGVPKSTLEFKIKNPGHKDTCGPNPILSTREESDLVRWIEELATKGFPRKREDILNSVQKFLTENPRPNPFKNNRPADSWFKAFLKRHPTIVQRTSEAVSGASACVSEADIRKWFKDINSYLTSKNLIVDDPSSIYNGDESGFQICPETGKIFAGKGAKNVYSVEKGSPKESITVMFSFSASGLTCPPLIIYPYKRIPEKISQTVKDPDWGIGRSDNGWMTAETFYDYEGFTEEFLTLYKIWSYFEKPDSLPNDKKDDLDMIDVPGSFNNQVLKLTEAEPELDILEADDEFGPWPIYLDISAYV
nr:uncharacterized protein LOC111420562 [Onthophagus taurus]